MTPKSSRRRRMAASLVGITVAGVALVACSSSSDSTGSTSGSSTTAAPAAKYTGAEAALPAEFTTPEKKSGYSFTVGWSTPDASIPSLSAITTGLKAEVAAMGGQLKVLDNQLNPQLEVTNFNLLLSEKVDAIVSFPINPSGLAPSLAAAKAAGVPVITIDTPGSAGVANLDGASANILLSRDRGTYEMASKAAQVDPGADFATISSSLPIPTLAYVLERDKYWAEKSGMKYLGDVADQSDTPNGAAAAMQSLLAKYPNVKVVFTYNDVSGTAAAAQALVSGNRDVKVFGFNGEPQALQSVKSKQMYGTFNVSYVDAGAQAVDGLYSILTKQNLPITKEIAINGQLVTQ